MARPDLTFPFAWPPNRAEKLRPMALPPIVYEDDDLLVVDKPGDVVCHPSKAGPWSSLVGALREHTALPTVHLIFRLDRETSGVLLVAKSAACDRALKKQIEDRTGVDKTYLALTWGEPDPSKGASVGAVVLTIDHVIPSGSAASHPPEVGVSRSVSMVPAASAPMALVPS